MAAARKRPAGQAKRSSNQKVDFDVVKQIGHEFPGVEDSTSYGTAALKVKGVFLLRLREDGETLALRTTFLERDLLLEADPETYFVTDHYVKYSVHLGADVSHSARRAAGSAGARVAAGGAEAFGSGVRPQVIRRGKAARGPSIHERAGRFRLRDSG